MKRAARQPSEAGREPAAAPRGRRRQLLVIGYGNTLRGDDGAGPAAAERVRAWALPHVTVITCHQLTPELADACRRADFVVFVDALTPGPEPAGLRFERLHQLRPPSYSPHAVSCPCSLLSLTRDLYEATPEGWIAGIPGEAFDACDTLSNLTRGHLEEALRRIRILADGAEPPESRRA